MKNKIDIKKWKEFKIGDLFDIHPTKSYKMNNSSLMTEDGINPVVVNSCYNNGIGGYTNYECTESGNMITFSDTTSADSIFYQKNSFVGYPHVQGMYPIGEYKDKWSEYIYLFFVTLFREKAIDLNYDYVNKFTRIVYNKYNTNYSNILFSTKEDFGRVIFSTLTWKYSDFYNDCYIIDMHNKNEIYDKYSNISFNKKYYGTIVYGEQSKAVVYWDIEEYNN